MAALVRALASVRPLSPASPSRVLTTAHRRSSLFSTRFRTFANRSSLWRNTSMSSDSDADASYITHLAEIPTIGEQYRKSVLVAVQPGNEKHSPNLELNEKVSLYQGDITQLEVDAIVNAANKSLLGGGGVDGAIHRAAGAHLLEECRTLNGCSSGDAKITRGYCLPANHVIHTVGPIYSATTATEHAEVLESCYRRSLEVAIENSCIHVAFPAISTGIYRYPIEDATHIALGTVRKFLETEAANKIERVIFVVWSNRDLGVYESLIPEYFPPDPAASGQDDVPTAEPREPSPTGEKQGE